MFLFYILEVKLPTAKPWTAKLNIISTFNEEDWEPNMLPEALNELINCIYQNRRLTSKYVDSVQQAHTCKFQSSLNTALWTYNIINGKVLLFLNQCEC